MGHTRLGELPATRNWRQVVSLLDGGGDTAQIALATADAAERGLALADSDEGLAYSFFLLTQVPLAAKSDDFAAALKDLGVSVSGDPSLFDLAGGIAEAVAVHARQTGRKTDIGEMARLAAVESLVAVCRRRPKDLFLSETEDVRRTLAEHATPTRFSTLAHEYFSRFLGRFLTYHLSRELSMHVGPGRRRFKSIPEHNEFKNALELHCRQTAKIVQTFAGGWHSKTNYESGITLRKAGNFVHVALSKMIAELEKRGGADDS
jgi:hypothetical protein